MSDDARTDGGTTVKNTTALRERYDALKGEESTVAVVSIIGLLAFPWLFIEAPVVSGFLKGYESLASLILIWAIFAIGFDLLLGYTGLLSFGHAAFWGTAAYASANVSAYLTGSPLVMVLLGTVIAVGLAWLLGYLTLRRGGIYFSILTLAFAQMMFYMSSSVLATYPGSKTPLTNGENGFTGVSLDPLLGMFELNREMPSILGEFVGTWHYGFIAVFTFLAIVIAYRILNSPYGLVFKAIRENEQRTEFVGLNVWRYKLMSFIISGTFAGVAGSLFTIHSQYVPLSSLYWTSSGEVVIMTVLGGAGSLFGPIFGAAVYLWVENIVSGMPNIGAFWHLILGLVFVVVIVLVPDGIWGLPDAVRRAWGYISNLGGDR